LPESEFHLLRDTQRIVDFDAEVTDGAFEFRMPEQQLHRSQVAGLLVNQRRLGPPHRVRSISRAIQTGALDPAMDDSSVLSRRDMRQVTAAAREKELAARWPTIGKPIADRRPSLLGDLELDRPVGLLLNNSDAVANMSSHADVVDPEPHKIASAQLAIDREIEEG